MNSEIVDLKIAIDKWRAAPSVRRRAYPIEIKKRALALLPKHSPKVLSKQLGLCVSMFYSWRNAMKDEQLELSTTKSMNFKNDLVSATKFHFEPGPPKTPDVIARIEMQNFCIDIFSSGALVAVCEKLTGRQI
jgi:hypothetical protein